MLSVKELASTLDRLDHDIRQGVDRGNIANVMARAHLELVSDLSTNQVPIPTDLDWDSGPTTRGYW
jgi:hypothetical protein